MRGERAHAARGGDEDAAGMEPAHQLDGDGRRARRRRGGRRERTDERPGTMVGEGLDAERGHRPALVLEERASPTAVERANRGDVDRRQIELGGDAHEHEGRDPIERVEGRAGHAEEAGMDARGKAQRVTAARADRGELGVGEGEGVDLEAREGARKALQAEEGGLPGREGAHRRGPRRDADPWRRPHAGHRPAAPSHGRSDRTAGPPRTATH